MRNGAEIKGVILDVDGTLYDPFMLRKKMLFELAQYCIRHPYKMNDVRILKVFRTLREKNAGYSLPDLEQRQYIWTSEKIGVAPKKIQEVVHEWLFERPLKYLRQCRYPGLLEFLKALSLRKIAVAFFSDYPTKNKLSALEVPFEIAFCATDSHVHSLKPNPRGFLLTTEALRVSPKNCLAIGDRDDRDGEAARSAGLPFFHLKHQNARGNLFSTLLNTF